MASKSIMMYSVSYDEASGTVAARVFGKALHSDHMAAREEAKRICSERHCKRLLVDLRDLDTEHSTDMDMFSFGRSTAKYLTGLRVAYVVPQDGKSTEGLRFTLMVGESPSVIAAEFVSYDAALEWLQKGL